MQGGKRRDACTGALGLHFGITQSSKWVCCHAQIHDLLGGSRPQQGTLGGRHLCVQDGMRHDQVAGRQIGRIIVVYKCFPYFHTP